MKNVDKAMDKEYISNVLGIGTPSDPIIAFIDKRHTIFHEQWSIEGQWQGWCTEQLEPAEYFKRKLQGK